MPRPSNELIASRKKVQSLEQELFRTRAVLEGEIKRVDAAKMVFTKLREFVAVADELRAVAAGVPLPLTEKYLVQKRKEILDEASKINL